LRVSSLTRTREAQRRLSEDGRFSPFLLAVRPPLPYSPSLPLPLHRLRSSLTLSTSRHRFNPHWRRPNLLRFRPESGQDRGDPVVRAPLFGQLLGEEEQVHTAQHERTAGGDSGALCVFFPFDEEKDGKVNTDASLYRHHRTRRLPTLIPHSHRLYERFVSTLFSFPPVRTYLSSSQSWYAPSSYTSNPSTHVSSSPLLSASTPSSQYSVWDQLDDLVFHKINESDVCAFQREYPWLKAQVWGLIWTMVSCYGRTSLLPSPLSSRSWLRREG
jgi:hypothetical protein